MENKNIIMNKKLQKGHLESQLRWKTKEFFFKSFYLEIIIDPQKVAARMYTKVWLSRAPF